MQKIKKFNLHYILKFSLQFIRAIIVIAIRHILSVIKFS